MLPRDGASVAFPNNAERFYSVDYGPVHLIALDTEAAFLSSARRQEQIDWLVSDLQASQQQPWRIAFFHRPPYSSGTEHGSDLAIRQAFGPLFEQYNVQVVLNGHEHSYERSVPWRESTNTSWQAVTYAVTGGGGAELHPAGTKRVDGILAIRLSTTCDLIISPTDATLEAVGTNGAVLDRFTLNLAQQKSDVAAPQVSIVSPAAGAIVSGTETIDADRRRRHARREGGSVGGRPADGRQISPSLTRSASTRRRWPTDRTRFRRAPTISTAGERRSRAP